jgi:hypothetical protein
MVVFRMWCVFRMLHHAVFEVVSFSEMSVSFCQLYGATSHNTTIFIKPEPEISRYYRPEVLKLWCALQGGELFV